MLSNIVKALAIFFIVWGLLESEDFRDTMIVAELVYVCYILYEICKRLG
jgi:hypothetical protein